MGSSIEKKKDNTKDKYIKLIHRNAVQHSKLFQSKGSIHSSLIDIEVNVSNKEFFEWENNLILRLDKMKEQIMDWHFKIEEYLKIPSNEVLRKQFQGKFFWNSYVNELKGTKEIPASLPENIKKDLTRNSFNIKSINSLARLFDKIYLDIKSTEEHPLNIIIDIFNKWFDKKCKSEKFIVSELYEKFKANLLFFISFYSFALMEFYGINYKSNYDSDISIIYATRIIFSTPIYDNYYKIVCEYKQNELLEFGKQIKTFANIKLNELKINPQFDINSINPSKCIQQISKKESKTEEKLLEENSLYSNSGKYLSLITSIRCPEEKIVHLESLNKIIAKEISDHYKINNIILQNKVQLDTDNLLLIIVFIIIKQNLVNIVIELEIMDTFLTESTKISSRGFFFSTLQIAHNIIKEGINNE